MRNSFNRAAGMVVLWGILLAGNVNAAAPIVRDDPVALEALKMGNNNQNLDILLRELLNFYKERDWEQFHSPKNLVMDLASETGELVEPFRWLTEQQSYELDAKTLQEVKDEIADVFKIIIYLSYKLGIDPVQATHQKLEKMQQKYPVEACAEERR